MTTLTQEQQQEILKGLLKSAAEESVEKFEKKLKDAKKAGFDFFDTRLSEPYELDGDLLLQGTSLIEDILVKHYPKELIEIFFKEEIITRNNIENLYSYINGSNDFTQLNLNFIKFSLNYISNERIQVDQNVFENICKAVKNTMINSFSKFGECQYSAVQANILGIEEVVILLLPLLDENKREKFKNGFDKLKNKVQALFKPTTSTPLQQTQPTASDTTQKKNPQEILKGLFKSAIEKDTKEAKKTKEFEKQLEDAKRAGFDFFNTRLNEDYKINDNITIDQDTSLVIDMRVMKQRYPKELIEAFLKQGIITQDNITNLYDNIRSKGHLTTFCNLNFIKLSLDHIRNERIKIDQKILKKICDAVINTMIGGFSQCRLSERLEVREDILKIEEVVNSLLPLLDENEKEKFKNAFYKLKNKVEAEFNITTTTPPQQKQTISGDPQKVASNATPLQQPPVNPQTTNTTAPQQEQPISSTPQKVTGSAAPFEEILIDNETNNNLESEKQDNAPPITTHNSKQEHFLGISTRGWIIISTCAIVGGAIGATLVATGIIPMIAAIGLIATAVLAGAAGAVTGGVIGGGMACLTQIVISKCCGEEAAVHPA